MERKTQPELGWLPSVCRLLAARGRQQGRSMVALGLASASVLVLLAGLRSSAESPPDRVPQPPEPAPATAAQPPIAWRRVCTQLLQVGGFEGSPSSVYSHWVVGGPAARNTDQWYVGDPWSSMRVAAARDNSTTRLPDGFFYQTITMPTELYTMTEVRVRGYELAEPPVPPGALLWCNDDRTDPGDALYLMIRDENGVPLASGNGMTIATGADVSPDFEHFDLDVTHMLSPVTDYAGEPVQVYFHSVNDPDEVYTPTYRYDCTFLYVDALETEVCTHMPPFKYYLPVAFRSQPFPLN